MQKMPLRVLMMGTGTFAIPSFQGLIESEHDVVGLVTQPDRTGRGHHQHVNAMKETALRYNVDVFQPQAVNSPDSLIRLQQFEADIFVVAAYGQILSPELLQIPPLGAINLHGSLLPKYRGAAPVQYAVLNGEQETGVTIFQIEPKLDAGPILGVVKTEIGVKETSGALHDRLAELATPLTLEVLRGLESGTLQKIEQEPTAVSKAPKIRKEQGLIDWSNTSEEIAWHVFGMQPWPMAFTFLDRQQGKTVRLLILDVTKLDDVEADQLKELSPGQIRQQDQRLLVRSGNGGVEVLVVKPDGKREMTADEFLRGTDLSKAKFGDHP